MTTKINLFFLLLANLSLVALSLIDNGRGPLYPHILDLFSFTGQQGSWFFSLATIFSLLSYMLAKWWLRPLGVVLSSAIGVLLLGLCSLGLATSVYIQSPIVLYLFSALLGVGIAFCSSTMNILVVQGSPVHLRRRFLAALHAVYGLSSFAAPLLLSGIILLGSSWKSYFVVTGILPLLVFIYAMKSYRRNLKVKVEDPSQSEVKGQLSLFPKVFFSTVIGICVGGEIAISTRLPLLMERHYLLDTHHAGLYLSAFFCFLMTGRLILAFKNFRMSSENLLKICLIVSLLLFLFGNFIHPFGFSVIGLTIGPFFPTAMDFLSHRFEKNYEEIATAVLTAVGISMSAMHFVFGLFTDWWGIENAFYIVPFLFLLSFTLFQSGKLKFMARHL